MVKYIKWILFFEGLQMAVIDIIKYEGNNETLVWKHPREDYNKSAQLIVHESQEAIVFNNGSASNIYKHGKYTLESNNIPGIRGMIELLTSGVSPNHYEVYFINKSYTMDINWGTADPMVIQDPVYKVPLNVRAFGQFSVKVINSRQLVLKLVGKTTSFTKQKISDVFRGVLISTIKENISKKMIDEEVSIVEMNSHLTKISNSLKSVLSDKFANYGLGIEEFFVESINPEKDDIYYSIMEALKNRTTRNIEGQGRLIDRSMDIAEKQAENQGMSGAVAGLGVGVGVAAASGQMMGGMMQRAYEPLNSAMQQPYGNGYVDTSNDFGVVKPKQNVYHCSNCGKVINPEDKFCSGCGAINAHKITCPNCGNEIDSDSVFCAKCGSRIQKAGE